MPHVIQMAGYSALVDEAVVNSSNHSAILQLLSMVGSREAVRAIWARLLRFDTAALRDERGKGEMVRLEQAHNASFYTQRLPSGAYHGLLVAPTVISRECLLAETEADLPRQYLAYLHDHVALPLSKEWAGWLWQHALTNEYVSKLGSLRCHAYSVSSYQISEVAEQVRQALLQGLLPAI